MEPRIHSLINPTLLERRPDDLPALSQSYGLPPPARPTPVEPNYVVEEIHNASGTRLHGGDSVLLGRAGNIIRHQHLLPKPDGGLIVGHDGSIGLGSDNQPSVQRSRSNHGVPIAEVLNEVEPRPVRPSRGTSLKDILIETPRKRRKVDEPRSNDTASTVTEAVNGSSKGTHLTLPKPRSRKKKAPSTLPPLLQGLHQPPPDAGIFPRIEEGPERPVVASLVETDNNVNAAAQLRPTSPNFLLKDGIDGGEKTSASLTASEPSGRRVEVRPTDASKNSGAKAKRNKWSDEETADLLKGVAKFGIGKWKAILECEEYTFNGRTTVDLKDRFRTCRPADYVKDKRSALSSHDKSLKAGEGPAKAKRKPRSKTDRKTNDDLARLEIKEPFQQSQRRQRRPFSEREDEALLRGYEKYGSKWHLIKGDADLDLNSRQPTDLRDRFRNRFPDRYKDQGLKIGNKVENLEHNDISAPETHPEPEQIRPLEPRTEDQPVSTSLTTVSNPPQLPSASQTSLQPMRTHFQDLLISSPIDHESGDEYSPVALNRNIFDWVDANAPPIPPFPNQLPPVPQETIPSTTQHTTNITVSMLMANEPAQHSSTSAGTLSLTSLATSSTSRPHPYGQELPSLSTLTLPSATLRDPMLSLPPPADILNGFDLESRGLLWEDQV